MKEDKQAKLGDGFNLVTGSGRKVNPPEGLLEPTNDSEMQYRQIFADIFDNGTESRYIGDQAWRSLDSSSEVEKMTAEFDLSDFTGQKVTIRFQFGANAWHGGDGANFDNIVVEGTALPDTDGDGMSDRYEDANGLDKNTDDRAGDLDGDALTNIQEFERCTDPQEADTDGDGLADNVETDTDPLLKDSDGDTLDDGVETNTGTFVNAMNTGTDPNKFDTDGDGSSDALELNQGSDPTDADSMAEATVEIIGTGQASFLGGDLTDPEDDGDTASGEDDASWNWVSIDANHKPEFANQGAFSVFDNRLGKWCCSPARENEPLHVTVEFSEPIALTHFTITSGGDRPGRDPSHWQIQGSNDGETFAPIFIQQDSKSIWTQRNQVAQVTLPNPSQPYKFIRYEATKFTDDGALYHQLGELEFFGNPVSTESFSLTISQSEHGTVSANPDAPYAAGTEVTLTATPNEGYEFAGWTAKTVSGEPGVTTVFDNLDHRRDEFISPSWYDRRFAQQFHMDGATTLTKVELELFRIGTIAGVMGVELWSDSGADSPGMKIASIGTIDDVSSMPTSDTVYTFDTGIADLDPQGKYWVVNEFRGITSPINGSNTIGWTWTFSSEGANTTTDSFGYRDQDGWTDMTVPFGGVSQTLIHQMRVQTQAPAPSEPLELPNENPLTFTIEADTTLTPEFVLVQTDPFIIATTEDGEVTKVPDLGVYPIGTAVTVTASPEPGFEFVKWTYGEEEFTTNPATITVTSGATLTPKFAPVETEPKPIDVEILPAFAIRWDSEAGVSYDVQSSSDLQNWTTDAGGVEGTGEPMTHFFIRDAREMYYRVLEIR